MVRRLLRAALVGVGMSCIAAVAAAKSLSIATVQSQTPISAGGGWLASAHPDPIRPHNVFGRYVRAMRAFALFAVLTTLLFAATASAANSSYILKRPTRERCKTHYIRQTKQIKVHGRRVRQVWCVFRTPTVTRFGSVGHRGTVGEPGAMVTVAVSVVEEKGGGQYGLLATVTLTITDTTTGKRIASFTEPNDTGCAISETLNAARTEETLAGTAIPDEYLAPIPACHLAPVTKPAADGAAISASFAGNSTYGPSASRPARF
jgi:hypothetical protein